MDAMLRFAHYPMQCPIKQWIRLTGVITVYIRQWSNGSRRLIMLLVLMLLVNVVVGYDHSVNYWQAFAPGKLLQRLDALTSSSAELPRAQAKLDESIEATDVDVDDDVEAEADSQSVEAQSGEDYERNYEQFVREYFDRTDDDGEEDAEALEDSVETQAEASNVQPAKKKKDEKESQRCRSVHRHGQLCKICREARNNEVSETCSYSHEAEPERYAYGSGTKYKRYRDMDNDDDETTRRRRRREQEENSSSNSLCERRLIGKSVCYECKDSGGQRLKRCYDTETNKQISSNGDNETAKKEQRIYKRTISYTYQQNDNDQDDDTPTTTTTTTTSTTPTPVKKRLSRIVRRRVAIPVSYLI